MSSNSDHNKDEFQAWTENVDALCLKRLGLSLHDLPDMMTRHGFDAGDSPEDFFDETVVPRARDDFGDDLVDSALGDSLGV